MIKDKDIIGGENRILIIVLIIGAILLGCYLVIFFYLTGNIGLLGWYGLFGLALIVIVLYRIATQGEEVMEMTISRREIFLIMAGLLIFYFLISLIIYIIKY